RFSGAPRQHPVPAAGGEQARVRAHPERLGRGTAAHHRRAARDAPAAGRRRGPSPGARALRGDRAPRRRRWRVTTRCGGPGPLPAARRFMVLAVLEGAVFVGLALLAVWAYRSQVAAARDRLWVAMARESAHQLGTPLMSLTGWIAYVRENPGTPLSELADHL